VEIYFSSLLAAIFLLASLRIYLPTHGVRGVLAQDLLLSCLALLLAAFLFFLLLNTANVLFLFFIIILSSFAFSLLLSLRREYLSYLKQEREQFFALGREMSSPGFDSFLANK
jgi:Flp pilus assembly protein TadB